MSDDDSFGDANLDPPSNSGTFWKRFKLMTPDTRKGEDKTELVLRLLPAMKSYKSTGRWRFYYGQHFGFCGVNKKDPSKVRHRPFACVQERVKGVTTVECPMCDEINRVKKQKEDREYLIKQENPNANDLQLRELRKNDEQLNNLSQWLKDFNCQRQVYINAMSPTGEFGVLQLSYTTVRDVLEPFLKEMRDRHKRNVFDVNGGYWLRFTRTGIRPQVKDAVACEMTEISLPDGTVAEVPKKAPLSPEQQQQALKICPDLAKDIVKSLSVAQIEQLIGSNNDPEVVDAIWDGGKTAKTTTASSANAMGFIGDASPQLGGSSKPSPTPAVKASSPQAFLQEIDSE